MTREEALNWFAQNKKEVDGETFKAYTLAERALLFDQVLSDQIDEDNLVVFYFDIRLLNQDIDFNKLVEFYQIACKSLPPNKATILLPYPINLEILDRKGLKKWIDVATEVYEKV